MGDKSEILDSLSKWSTGTILAVILGCQIWINHENDQQWSERLASIMERQASAEEQNVEQSKNLGDALLRILEDRND